MSAIALINHSGSQVVIKDGDRIFTIAPGHPEPKEQSLGFHIGMYLQPAMNQIEQRPAGVYPYPEIYDYVTKSYDKQMAYRMVKIGIDADLPLSHRTEAMEVAEVFLSDSEVREFVLEELISIPFVPDGSVNLENLPETGHVGEMIKTLKEKWSL